MTTSRPVLRLLLASALALTALTACNKRPADQPPTPTTSPEPATPAPATPATTPDNPPPANPSTNPNAPPPASAPAPTTGQ